MAGFDDCTRCGEEASLDDLAANDREIGEAVCQHCAITIEAARMTKGERLSYGRAIAMGRD